MLSFQDSLWRIEIRLETARPASTSRLDPWNMPPRWRISQFHGNPLRPRRPCSQLAPLKKFPTRHFPPRREFLKLSRCVLNPPIEILAPLTRPPSRNKCLFRRKAREQFHLRRKHPPPR